jgi:hypothetical protein
MILTGVAAVLTAGAQFGRMLREWRRPPPRDQDDPQKIDLMP